MAQVLVVIPNPNFCQWLRMEASSHTSHRKLLVLGGVAVAAATVGIVVARRRARRHAVTSRSPNKSSRLDDASSPTESSESKERMVLVTPMKSGAIDAAGPVTPKFAGMVESTGPFTPRPSTEVSNPKTPREVESSTEVFTAKAPLEVESTVFLTLATIDTHGTSITWDTLSNWSSSLRRKDAAELPTLLAWTERLLQEQPSHPALSSCLVGLQNLTSPGDEAADRVAVVAILASGRELDKSLDVLNLLFKDPKLRGLSATKGVVEFALETLRTGMAGSVQRGAIQRTARLVNFLTENAGSRSLLIESGGASLILNAMEHFKSDPGVLVAGCSSIRSLVSEPSLDLGRAVDVNIACCRDHIAVGDIQWRALAALHGLPHWSESDAATLVTDLACAAAERHPHFDTVVEWVAKVLHRLVKSRTNGIRDRFKNPTRKAWLVKFRKESFHIRKPNKEAEHWVNELYSLCGK